MIGRFIRTLGRNKQFIEGARIDPSQFRNLPFKNNFDNVAKMFEIRSWYIQNTPCSFNTDKVTNEMAILHKQLNYLQGRTIIKRLMMVVLAVTIYNIFIFQESAIDWRDKFDNKFSTKVYGSLDDSSGEGDSGIDD